jgi:hypothetical protein
MKRIRSIIKRIGKLNRNTKLAGILVLVLLVVGVWSYFFNRNTTSQQIATTQQTSTDEKEIESAPVMGATLSYLEGVVEYKDDSGAWSKATKDLAILKDNGLRTTGVTSRAIVTLEDGSAIRLDGDTEILFDSLTKSRVTITQEAGYVYSRIVTSSSRSYFVNTEDAQYQALGTAFRTTSSGDEQSVEVFHNNVKETRNNTSVAEGEKLIVKNEADLSKNKTKDKMDIEKIKEDKFITWNRQQDSADPNFKSALGFLNDIEGPKIEVTEPAVGSTVEIEGDVSTGTINIKGKTDKDTVLTVQSKSQSGSSPVQASVSEDGSFETGNINAPLGNSVFELVGTDKIGNKTKLNVSYTVKKKTVSAQQGIALTLVEADGKVKLSWGLVGITTPDGVKLLYNKEGNPTFPDDIKQYIPSGTTNVEVDMSSLTSGKRFSFKICRYDTETDSCDIYSNEVVSTEIP